MITGTTAAPEASARTTPAEAAGTDRLRALIDASPFAIVELDRDGVVREWNPAAVTLFGWDAAEVLGQVLPPELTGGALDLPRLLATLESGKPLPTLAVRARRRTGAMVDVEVSAAATRDPAGQVAGVMGLLVDVTERKRLERQLQHQAQYDVLTGLPNRSLLATRLEAALAAAAPGRQTGLLLIDLDKFKEVNDTLGHASGDLLLAQVGPRLIAAALRQDDTVARLGGDEFAVLLPDLSSAADAIAVAERVLSALHAPFSVDGTTVDIAASIGIAIAPQHGTDPTELLRHADTAMYAAKETSAGAVVYEPNRDRRPPTRFLLLGELRRAMDRDELVPFYQPKIDMATGELHGVEALVRWQHPQRGLLGPDEFIPVAETTGLIHRLTTYMLDRALAQTRIWADAGMRVPVAVNLSTRCLQDATLPARVLTLLAKHGVPASLLRLEITESAIMSDPARALVILRELNAAGVKLSLDDFGTGYSSMSYLRQLPVDEIKVDRSFVLDLAGEQADAVLVRSAVDLGHNLGLSVVAEGVEDVPTLTALHELGCDIAQGYHFGRPMPAEDFEAWLAASAIAAPPMSPERQTDVG